jgi:hypothetical protein
LCAPRINASIDEPRIVAASPARLSVQPTYLSGRDH